MSKQIVLLLLMTGTFTKQNLILEKGRGEEEDNENKFPTYFNFEKLGHEDVNEEHNFSDQFKLSVGEKKQESFLDKFPFKINKEKKVTSWAQNYEDLGDYDEESLFNYFDDNDHDHDYGDNDHTENSDPIVKMCQWRSFSRLKSKRVNINSKKVPESDCDCQQNGTSLVCCSSYFPQNICRISDSDVSSDIKHLYIVGLTHHSIDLNKQFIKKLKISPQNLRSITLRKTNVVSVNIFDNGEHEFGRYLTSLDLRNNRIASFELPNLPKLEQLYLSENNWECIHQESFPEEGQNMEWLLDKTWLERWKDEGLTNCSTETQHGSWKNNQHERDGWFDEEVPHKTPNLRKFLNFMKVMRQDCPPSCDCRRINAKVTTVKGRDFKEIFIIGVNCYSLNLTSLPNVLPPKTIFLDVSDNQISDLSPLLNNKHYKDLRILNLENNFISSMEPLRNSKLEQINLSGNKLSHLDLDLLEPILEYLSTRPKSEHELDLQLSWNPYSCSCSNIKLYQNFLVKYDILIKDAKKIKCKEFKEVNLVDLDYNDMCAIHMDWMYVLIAVEVFLLVSILLKLGYDILMYQRSGRLPWVARHLCCSALSSSTWWAEHREAGPWWGRSQSTTDSLTRGYGEAGTICSSGYITNSGASSHTDHGIHGQKEANADDNKEGEGEGYLLSKEGDGYLLVTDTQRNRETSVVRFLSTDQSESV